jgi:hypothetical protein
MLNRDDKERRSGLRRLDDILETLEQLNLHDKTELPDHVAEALVLLGIDAPHDLPVPQLIERVWAMQQPYLITIVVERRRRRRRKVDPKFTSDPGVA